MVRLDKYLADAGIGTRSEVKNYIKHKWITVDGMVAQKPEQKIDPGKAHICFQGEHVVYEEFSYFLFHKPSGCVTARSASREKTVMDFFAEEKAKGLSPVGRLDKDTEGLLLITNDGARNHRLMSPSHHVPKTYYAILDQPIPEDAVERFHAGVDIGDEKPTLPARLEILPEEFPFDHAFSGENGRAHARLTITEGRYHQVKRMFAAIGCEVLYLKRLSMGPLELGDLRRGEYRRLTDEELRLLQQI